MEVVTREAFLHTDFTGYCSGYGYGSGYGSGSGSGSGYGYDDGSGDGETVDAVVK